MRACRSSISSADVFDVCNATTGPGREDALSVAGGLGQVLQGTLRVFEYEHQCIDPRYPCWMSVRISRGRPGPQPLAVIAYEDITVRKTANIIIGTFCIERDHTLLHDDRDFAPMEARLGLRGL